jgi:hypothetical protein
VSLRTYAKLEESERESWGDFMEIGFCLNKIMSIMAGFINKMGKEVDGLAILDAMDAADAAQGGRVQNFLNQAMSQQKAASISTAAETGSQALADAVGRAMAGPGGTDIQGQIKDAIDAQLKVQQEQAKTLSEINEGWKRFKPGQVPQVRGV